MSLTQRVGIETCDLNRVAVIDGINTILRAVLHAQTEEELGFACLDVAERVTGSAFGFIAELHEDGLLYDVALSNPGWEGCRESREGGHARLRERMRAVGLHGTVVRTGVPFYTNDPSAHPDRVGAPAWHPPLSSFLGVPLRADGRSVGLVAVANRPGGYDGETQEALETLAPAITEAFERMRADRRARRELETSSLLLKAARALSESTDINRLLDRLAAVTLEAVGHRRVTISMIDEERGGTVFASAAGENALPTGTFTSWDDLSPVYREVLREGRTRIADHGALPAGDRGASSETEGRLTLMVPLVLGGRVLGHIGIDDPGERVEFSEREIAIAEGIASQAAIAVTNAELLANQRKQTKVAQALNDISEAVHSTLDNRQILARVVEDIARATGLNAVAIHLREEGAWRFAYTYGLPRELTGLRYTDEQSPMSMSVIRAREPLSIPDAFTDPRANRPFVTRFDIRSLVGVPLIVRGEPFGVLFAGSTGKLHRFSAADLNFMNRVATTLSLALENARLYEGEHRVAATLQQALLALPDRVPGISFAYAYRSASEAALVGGDFYDIFDIGRDRIGVVIGDVAGKGLEAAVLTSTVKSTIRAHIAAGMSLSEALALTNASMYRETPEDVFVTVFVAEIGCTDGHLRYSNAGHTTPVIARPGGPVLLPANGPILGAFERVEFGESESYLALDELLVLYTDGLVEARAEGRQYGQQRLFDLVASIGDGDPPPLVRAIISDVLGFTGNTLSDDVAILALKRLGREEATPEQREIAI